MSDESAWKPTWNDGSNKKAHRICQPKRKRRPASVKHPAEYVSLSVHCISFYNYGTWDASDWKHKGISFQKRVTTFMQRSKSKRRDNHAMMRVHTKRRKKKKSSSISILMITGTTLTWITRHMHIGVKENKMLIHYEGYGINGMDAWWRRRKKKGTRVQRSHLYGLNLDLHRIGYGQQLWIIRQPLFLFYSSIVSSSCVYISNKCIISSLTSSKSP